MKRYLIIIYAVAICLFLSCCTAREESPVQTGTLPPGLMYDVEGVPPIEDFSDSTYEDFMYYFPPISYAVYYHDGQEEHIASDDPRLLRLMSFLAYSEETSSSEWRQGYLQDNEINAYLNCTEPMLEVVFDYDRTGGQYFNVPRILICGHTYLLFADTEDPSWVLGQGLYADQRFPYMELVSEMVWNEELDKSVLFLNELEGECWLDLLTYTGFSD